MTRILVVDNYDSFVYNLVAYLGQLGAECEVRRNDAIALPDVAGYDGVLISPGPGVPETAGVCIELVRQYADRLPILGVCLGHQAIAAAFGAVIARAPELLHGKTSEVYHGGAGVLVGLPDPFTATRYHSLAVVEESVPAQVEVTARTLAGVIMALRVPGTRVEGVQFHPESVLTEGGHHLLANWLTMCGRPEAFDRVPAFAAVVEERRLAALV